MNALTFTEQEAVGFFFKDYPESWDVEQILDALADQDERVQLWRMFKDMHPEDINSAVNDLMRLLRNTRKQAGLA